MGSSFQLMVKIMKKWKRVLINVGGSALLVLAVVTAVVYNKRHLFHVNADQQDYELLFNSNNRIHEGTSAYTSEENATTTTTIGNQLTLTTSNVVKNNSGWQTINSGGYIFNPVTNVGANNKISGIKSVKYTSNASNTLSLYYGYSLNNTEIIYSFKETITAGTTFTFNNDHPSYIYLQNDNNTAVNITTLSIKYSCSAETYPMQNLNILMIGNSFSDDTIFYTARMAQSYGININIYDSYIAGCTINQHYNNLQNDVADYSMRTMNGDSWSYSNGMTLSQILAEKTWDIVTFQQASAEIGRSTSYSNLSNLVNLVKTKLGYNPKLIWNQTWAYDKAYQDNNDYFAYFNNDQISMYNAIVSCYQNQVAPLDLFSKIIPAGTAVQNMRTSYMKDTITRDGKHMSSTHGRYLLSLNFLSSVYGIDLAKSPCTYLPFDINESYLNVATECVRNAIRNPLAVTNSAYTTGDIGNYNLSNYTEIDAGLVGCSYWDAKDSTNYNKRLQNVSGTSNKYVSTQRFTSTTLPVGSIISVDEAFGVELQTWTSDSQQSGTMSDSYANVITVDNSFWNGYQYRAFNIFKASKSVLSATEGCVGEQFDQIFDGFHIYVPNAQMSGLTPKSNNSYYNADKTLMQSQYYNIDAYERIHLDPIIGFYKCDSYYYLLNSYVDDTAKKFVCTRPFHSVDGDLPENTIIIVDSGYQWRSDCWGSYGTHSRPSNVSSQFTVLTSSFWDGLRTRTFNVSSTSSAYVNQNAIAFMNHMRIYVPISDDYELERPVLPDTVTMTALGYANANSTLQSMLGKSQVPVLITLFGDDVNRVIVEVNGSDAGATNYTFNKSTGALSITTTGSVSGYSYGNVTGTVNRDAGTISNVAISGSLKSFVTNNGSITCSESWHDRCNYSTNAASQAVWQRWYMSGSWQANSGSGEWTTANGIYKLDNDYSMGLRIANSSYQKTRFTLKQDFNNGAGFTPKGISIWLYNPNGNIYTRFRIYVYKTASTTSGDHAVPSGTYSQIYETTAGIGENTWKNIKLGMTEGTIYNVSFYFECSSSETTYVYLGHVSFY